ncbi:MAG TPA: ATP-dependent sacrificial sulfur transferase LarE [Candidatus Dormibacteraeota bacterium]|nr:ATP-dependent sacrificial sulfur transferase LarE [Candidatus Dormibacteraeota bacterium]
MTSPQLDDKLDAARARLRDCGSVLVAFSGGADSALVLALAQQALGDRAAAGMGLSAAYPAEEVDAARAVAAQLGVRFLSAGTAQLADPAFLRNDSQRCYHCRDELYTVMRALADAHGLVAVADGTNADDLGDHRPGRRAAVEAGVVSPLADAGITKDEVRQASLALGLPTWDKPQQACLSSRIPRGTPITLVALRRVEKAERLLHAEGFRQVRVREHGECARIEVEAEEITRLLDPAVRTRIVDGLRSAGYAFASLDLEGFASGKLNRLVPAEELEVAR